MISEGHIFSTTGLYQPLSLSNVSGSSDIFATLVVENLPELYLPLLFLSASAAPRGGVTGNPTISWRTVGE